MRHTHAERRQITSIALYHNPQHPPAGVSKDPETGHAQVKTAHGHERIETGEYVVTFGDDTRAIYTEKGLQNLRELRLLPIEHDPLLAAKLNRPGER